MGAEICVAPGDTAAPAAAGFSMLIASVSVNERNIYKKLLVWQ